MNAQDERYAVKITERGDVKMCNCAGCGRELIGLASRDQAHHLGMMVVTYVLDRPYCQDCGRAEGSRQMTCAHCGDAPFLRDMRVEEKFVPTYRRKLYCLWCSCYGPSRAKPRSIGERTDARERTRVPGFWGMVGRSIAG